MPPIKMASTNTIRPASPWTLQGSGTKSGPIINTPQIMAERNSAANAPQSPQSAQVKAAGREWNSSVDALQSSQAQQIKAVGKEWNSSADMLRSQQAQQMKVAVENWEPTANTLRPSSAVEGPIVLEDKIMIYSQTAHKVQYFGANRVRIETLASIDPSSIIILDKNNIQISYSFQNETDKKPRLELKEQYTEPLTVSYMFGNIGWTPQLNIIFDNDSEARIYLSAVMNNDTGETFDLNTVLMSGDIRQPQIETSSRSVRMSSMLARPAPQAFNESYASADTDTADAVPEDYKSYFLGKVQLYSKDIVRLNGYSIAIDKVYSHDLSSTNKVSFYYNFVAPDFIPKCRAKLYGSELSDGGNIGPFIGESSVKETQRNNNVDVGIGYHFGSCYVVLVESLPDKDIGMDDRVPPLTYLVKKSLKLSSDVVSRSHVDVKLVLKYAFDITAIKEFSIKPDFTNKDGYTEWFVNLKAISPDSDIPDTHHFECIVSWTGAKPIRAEKNG